uniref:Uncharacterized protein n=1 Tax=Octopus bimaculoides TaxID=37653 RepID=A0A0L8I8H9_OCTBM
MDLGIDFQDYRDLQLPLCILQLDPADRAVLRIADERDAVQKKTFTKWVNKHLLKVFTYSTGATQPVKTAATSPP